MTIVRIVSFIIIILFVIHYDQFKHRLMAVCHINTYKNFQDGLRQELDAKKETYKTLILVGNCFFIHLY